MNQTAPAQSSAVKTATTLNHLFSSFVAIGRPHSLGCKEKYMTVDGHVVRCCGTFRLSREQLPVELLEALPEEKEPAVWADGRGNLAVGYGVNGDLYQVAEIFAYPLGVFWEQAGRMPYQEQRLAERPAFDTYGKIVSWGAHIVSDKRAKATKEGGK